MNNPQYILSIYKLSKIYPGGKQVFKDISLSFLPGAKIGVLGGNGAGKSTLLKIMAGVDKEYNGEAKIANKSLNGGQLGVFSDSGIINLRADGSSDLKCIIVGGEKLNEPVARGGPFVMNTKAEILKAFSDYQEGILTK